MYSYYTTTPDGVLPCVDAVRHVQIVFFVPYLRRSFQPRQAAFIAIVRYEDNTQETVDGLLVRRWRGWSLRLAEFLPEQAYSAIRREAVRMLRMGMDCYSC